MAVVAERGAAVVLPATNDEIPDGFDDLLFASAMVIAITERLVPQRSEYVQKRMSVLAIRDLLEEFIPNARASVETDEAGLRERIEKQLAGPPFADLGVRRVALWNAYGTEWRVHWDNVYSATAVAEEFCAVLQIFLADIYSLDLYLLPTTVDIDVIVKEGATPALHPAPSNTTRMWTVLLPPNQTGEGFLELQGQVFAIGVAILSEISLLRQPEIIEMIETLFARGLADKKSVARPYSVLFRTFTRQDAFEEGQRQAGAPPLNWHPRVNEKLLWVASDGRSYQRTDALARIAARYENSLRGLKYTLPRLRRSKGFQKVVAELRQEGWRDWHILMAVLNATANLRTSAKTNAGGNPAAVFEEYRRKLARGGDEAKDEPAPPVRLYTVARLREALEISYLSTIRQLGFSVKQETPDFPAIGKFLRWRYHYWDDDIDHADPFITRTRASKVKRVDRGKE